MLGPQQWLLTVCPARTPPQLALGKLHALHTDTHSPAHSLPARSTSCSLASTCPVSWAGLPGRAPGDWGGALGGTLCPLPVAGSGDEGQVGCWSCDGLDRGSAAKTERTGLPEASLTCAEHISHPETGRLPDFLLHLDGRDSEEGGRKHVPGK